MKRIVCFVLALVLLCSMIACDSNSKQTQNAATTKSAPSTTATTNSKEKEFEAAKVAYEDLVTVEVACDVLIDVIYDAWYFTIYEEDDYYQYAPALSAFCSRTGLKKDVVSALVEKELENSGMEKTDSARVAVLSVTSCAIRIAISALEETVTSTEELLNLAKDHMKNLTSQYDDYTGYSTLKSYYSELTSYFAFCKSPSGSFNQLETTMNNYKTNCSKYKNELSIIFD